MSAGAPAVQGATSAAAPARLDRAGIAARIPHAGSMCLLDALLGWNEVQIRCRVGDHSAAAHPLRQGDRLPAPAAIEFASQAMALHAGLQAERSHGPGMPPTPGFLAAARAVTLHQPRLDLAPGPLQVACERLSGDAGQAIYRFELRDGADQLLVEGRATVVLNVALGQPGPTA